MNILKTLWHEPRIDEVFLDLEIRHGDFGIFVSQVAYVKDILKKSKMKSSYLVTTPMELDMKLAKFEGGYQVNANEYCKLVGSLRYLLRSGL